MAELGFRRMDDMIGRVDMLDVQPAVDHWKGRGLDLSAILYNPPVPSRVLAAACRRRTMAWSRPSIISFWPSRRPPSTL